MKARPPRICSLLPSATEIVYALALGDQLVGVTHECDYPAEARSKPQVTASLVDADELSAREIDSAVRESLQTQSTIYLLDAEQMEQLQPDLILTQQLCEVCAVGKDLVKETVRQLPGNPQVISLEPRSLTQVLDSILEVGRLTGTLRRAIQVTDVARGRLDAVRRAVSGRDRKRVLTLEWVDPVFVGGHWVPEMVEIAGGRDVLGRPGEPSREVGWDEVVAADPDVVVAMPCGFGLERSTRELANAELPLAWYDLRAVRGGEVWVVDGSSYFNRPGPRLIDGIEILAAILHPDIGSPAHNEAFARYQGTQTEFSRSRS